MRILLFSCLIAVTLSGCGTTGIYYRSYSTPIVDEYYYVYDNVTYHHRPDRDIDVVIVNVPSGIQMRHFSSRPPSHPYFHQRPSLRYSEGVNHPGNNRHWSPPRTAPPSRIQNQPPRRLEITPRHQQPQQRQQHQPPAIRPMERRPQIQQRQPQPTPSRQMRPPGLSGSGRQGSGITPRMQQSPIHRSPAPIRSPQRQQGGLRLKSR